MLRARQSLIARVAPGMGAYSYADHRLEVGGHAMDGKSLDFSSSSFAFDAASGTGLAFLASQLEMPEVKLVEPLASVTHDRDIPIKTGGGYVEYLSAWASNYMSTGNNQYGLQGTENTDVPMVQANVQKGIWPAFNWAATMLLTFLDLQKLITAKRIGMPAPYSLQQLLDNGIRLVWNKALDKVTYTGWAGSPGMINNAAVVATNVAGSGSGMLWTNKTPVQILEDINTGILTCQENSGYDTEGLPDRLLLNFENWAVLNQPMTTAGWNSVLEYVLENNVARRQGVDFMIAPLPDPWVNGMGVGGTNRMLYYRKDENSLYLRIPQPLQKVMTVPSVKDGGSYETLFSGCIGVPQWIRPTTALYQDGA